MAEEPPRLVEDEPAGAGAGTHHRRMDPRAGAGRQDPESVVVEELGEDQRLYRRLGFTTMAEVSGTALIVRPPQP